MAPLVSIRNGPISQSAGMARTMKKSPINAANDSTNPYRRRRRSSVFFGRAESRRICDPP